MTETEYQETIRKIGEWLESPEGQAKTKEIQEEVKKICQELEEQERIPYELLRQPVTI